MNKTLFEVLSNDSKCVAFFSILETIDDDESLTKKLSDVYAGPFTVLVPSNRLTMDMVTKMQGKNVNLNEILTYHIIDGKFEVPILISGGWVTALNGQPLMFSLREKSLYGNYQSIFINGKSEIIDSSIKCKNGIIHFIDKLLIPKHLTFKDIAKYESLIL